MMQKVTKTITDERGVAILVGTDWEQVLEYGDGVDHPMVGPLGCEG
jgi:hypothetical protein